MTKDFENLIQEDKLQYSLEELKTIKRLSDIKKNQNSPVTNFFLLFSLIAIGAGVTNLFYPILYTLSTQVLIYLATIPAFMNIAFKLRDISIKNAFKKEFGLSNRELQTFLKSDKMNEFEDMLTAIQNGDKEIDFIQIDDSVFSEFTDQELGIRLDDVQNISHSSVLTRLAEQLKTRRAKASNTKTAEKATRTKTTEKSLIAKKTATKQDAKKPVKIEVNKPAEIKPKRVGRANKAKAETQEDLENSI